MSRGAVGKDSGVDERRTQQGARRRPMPRAALIGVIVAAGLLTLLAGCSIASPGTTVGGRPSQSFDSETVTTGGEDGLPPTATTDNAPGTGTQNNTPTIPPYSGSNYLLVGYDPSSCHPGAVSPYPYLDVENTNQNTAQTYRISLSNGAFSLQAAPPNPILAGMSEFWAFVGPMSARAPLYVTIHASMGSWSGTLQACAIQKPPTPTPYVTVTPNIPTIQNLPITFTCAQAVASVSAELCVHTLPNAIVGIDSVNYACSNTSEHTILTAEGFNADANGNYTWQWVPNTDCQGSATVTVSGSLTDPAHETTYRGTATTTFQVQ